MIGLVWVYDTQMKTNLKPYDSKTKTKVVARLPWITLWQILKIRVHGRIGGSRQLHGWLKNSNSAMKAKGSKIMCIANCRNVRGLGRVSYID